MKAAGKLFLLLSLLSILIHGKIYADLLDNGVPSHSLGYADNLGYVLYTDKLFDLNLADSDPDEERAVMPIRIAFYTEPQHRKSILLDAYWSFPIFDSYLAKDDKNLIYWQTPDLNILKFRPSKDENTWETYGGYKKMRILKNGDYAIERNNSAAFEELIYDRNGLLKKISVKRKGGRSVFSISRTRNSLIVRDQRGNTILMIETKPVANLLGE